jgi:hypothetical protein
VQPKAASRQIIGIKQPATLRDRLVEKISTQSNQKAFDLFSESILLYRYNNQIIRDHEKSSKIYLSQIHLSMTNSEYHRIVLMKRVRKHSD